MSSLDDNCSKQEKRFIILPKPEEDCENLDKIGKEFLEDLEKISPELYKHLEKEMIIKSLVRGFDSVWLYQIEMIAYQGATHNRKMNFYECVQEARRRKKEDEQKAIF